jgi:hypothetical protein
MLYSFISFEKIYLCKVSIFDGYVCGCLALILTICQLLCDGARRDYNP